VLDLKWIRENPDQLRKGLAAKNSSIDVDKLLELDGQRRALLQEVENLKFKRNSANEDVVRLKKAGQKPEADALIASLKDISQNIGKIDREVEVIASKIDEMLYVIPNMVDTGVPIARGAEGNKVVRTWGKPKEAKGGEDHLQAGSRLNWLNMNWGSKITGTAFPVYLNLGARLERALVNFMIDMHVSKHGYSEVWPPALVNRASMTGTGQLPKFEEDMYRLKDDDFFLVPTAEVPVTNLLRDELLEEKKLPVKFVAYSPCFRREAGSYGKDTRGLQRVHQFDKVEMVKFVKPEDSLDELEKLVSNAEAVLQALELPYRVLLLGSGDTSFAAAKCYDLEAWAPVTGKWFEVSSCSAFADFQARRMNIRFRREKTNKMELVHTLNGSGVALARTVLCLLENVQPKGETAEELISQFPKALQPYLRPLI
jgi:seryl-tRNA synthetase